MIITLRTRLNTSRSTTLQDQVAANRIKHRLSKSSRETIMGSLITKVKVKVRLFKQLVMLELLTREDPPDLISKSVNTK